MKTYASRRRYLGLYRIPSGILAMLALLAAACYLAFGANHQYLALLFFVPLFYIIIAFLLELPGIMRARDTLIEIEDQFVCINGEPYAWREILLVQLSCYRDLCMNIRFTMELRIRGGGTVIDMSAVEPLSEAMLIRRMAQNVNISGTRRELKPARHRPDEEDELDLF